MVQMKSNSPDLAQYIRFMLERTGKKGNFRETINRTLACEVAKKRITVNINVKVDA